MQRVDMVECILWESSIRRVFSSVCKERKKGERQRVMYACVCLLACSSTIITTTTGSYWQTNYYLTLIKYINVSVAHGHAIYSTLLCILGVTIKW